MRSRICCLMSRSFARMRLRIVLRLTVNRPSLFFPLMCVKPRKSNVSGLPSPLRLRFSSANLPNSIRRVLSGCNSSPNIPSRSCKFSKKRSASAWCWNPKMSRVAEGNRTPPHLTEPDVRLSLHPAPTIQHPAARLAPSEQRGCDHDVDVVVHLLSLCSLFSRASLDRLRDEPGHEDRSADPLVRLHTPAK